MFEQTFKNIDDILHKDAGCTSELDYTEQSSWLLFLKYLDALEADKATEAELEGKAYSFILDKAYRWESWAAPKNADGKFDHNVALTGDDLLDFVNRTLFLWQLGGSSALHFFQPFSAISSEAFLSARCRPHKSWGGSLEVLEKQYFKNENIG